MLLIGLLSSAKSWAEDENITLIPSDQDAIARLVDDYELIKKQNEELKKQNELLAKSIELHKERLKLQKEYLAIEKERTEFYKELLEEERLDHKVDIERFKEITDDYKNLLDSQKPGFFKEILPILGIIATILIIL